eukprot:129631-Chlamydomonas_euryale.AAC.1
MSVPMVMVPYQLRMERVTSRHLTTTDVDDMASSAPTKAPGAAAESNIHTLASAPNSIAKPICAQGRGAATEAHTWGMQ